MTGDFLCGYKLLRELGARALPAFAAIDPKPRRAAEALCVVYRLAREPGITAEAAADFLRDAKRLALVKHPNLVRVRDVVVGTNMVLCATDWIDGEVLGDVTSEAAERSVPIPLDVSVRVIVDVLEGLSALHELRGARRERLDLVHAEIAPRNVVVALDGHAVLTHPLRGPPSKQKPTPDVVGYLAPEVLLGDLTADQRADVYGVGVLLWEALMGRRMHADGEAAGEIVVRLLGGKIDAPTAPAGAAWAHGLVDAARRAIAPDPGVRFANATEMLAEVRRVAGAHLAAKSHVAALVEIVAGARVRNRVARLGSAGELRLRTLQPGERADAPGSGPRVDDTDRAEASTPLTPPVDSVEVVDLELAPDEDTVEHPMPPPPPPVRPAIQRPPTPTASSRTDMAVISAVPDEPSARARRPMWQLGAIAACAAAGMIALWLVARPESAPSSTAVDRAPLTAPRSSATATSVTIPIPTTSPSPPTPLGDELPWQAESSEPHPPLPVPEKKAPIPTEPSPPLPTATPTPPLTQTPPQPPPPSPSPAPKKKPTYDPLGI